MVRQLRVFINHKIQYGYIADYSVKDVLIEFIGPQDDLFKIAINPQQYCTVLGNVIQNGRVDVIAPISVIVDINGIVYSGTLNVSINHGCLIIDQCRNHKYIKLSRTECFSILTEFKVAFRSISGDLLDQYLNEHTLDVNDDRKTKRQSESLTNDVNWRMYDSYSAR